MVDRIVSSVSVPSLVKLFSSPFAVLGNISIGIDHLRFKIAPHSLSDDLVQRFQAIRWDTEHESNDLIQALVAGHQSGLSWDSLREVCLHDDALASVFSTPQRNQQLKKCLTALGLFWSHLSSSFSGLSPLDVRPNPTQRFDTISRVMVGMDAHVACDVIDELLAKYPGRFHPNDRLLVYGVAYENQYHAFKDSCAALCKQKRKANSPETDSTTSRRSVYGSSSHASSCTIVDRLQVEHQDTLMADIRQRLLDEVWLLHSSGQLPMGPLFRTQFPASEQTRHLCQAYCGYRQIKSLTAPMVSGSTSLVGTLPSHDKVDCVYPNPSSDPSDRVKLAEWIITCHAMDQLHENWRTGALLPFTMRSPALWAKINPWLTSQYGTKHYRSTLTDDCRLVMAMWLHRQQVDGVGAAHPWFMAGESKNPPGVGVTRQETVEDYLAGIQSFDPTMVDAVMTLYPPIRRLQYSAIIPHSTQDGEVPSYDHVDFVARLRLAQIKQWLESELKLDSSPTSVSQPQGAPSNGKVSPSNQAGCFSVFLRYFSYSRSSTPSPSPQTPSSLSQLYHQAFGDQAKSHLDTTKQRLSLFANVLLGVMSRPDLKNWEDPNWQQFTREVMTRLATGRAFGSVGVGSTGHSTSLSDEEVQKTVSKVRTCVEMMLEQDGLLKKDAKDPIEFNQWSKWWCRIASSSRDNRNVCFSYQTNKKSDIKSLREQEKQILRRLLDQVLGQCQTGKTPTTDQSQTLPKKYQWPSWDLWATFRRRFGDPRTVMSDLISEATQTHSPDKVKQAIEVLKTIATEAPADKAKQAIQALVSIVTEAPSDNAKQAIEVLKTIATESPSDKATQAIQALVSIATESPSDKATQAIEVLKTIATEAKADKAKQAIEVLKTIATEAKADKATQAIEVLKTIATEAKADKANQAIEVLKTIATEAIAGRGEQAIQALVSIVTEAPSDRGEQAKQAIEALKDVAKMDSSDKANQAIETLKDIVLTYPHSGLAIEALESILLALPVDGQRITHAQVTLVLKDIQKVDLLDRRDVLLARSIPLSDQEKEILNRMIQSNTLLTDDQIGYGIVSPSLQQLCCWLDKCVTASQSLDQTPSSGIVKTRTSRDLSSSRSSTVSWLTIRLKLLQFLYQNRGSEVRV